MYAAHHPRLPPRRRPPASLAAKLGDQAVSADALTVIGKTSFRGNSDRFGTLAEDRLRHTWLVGKTGAGKSTLLSNLIAQDLARGVGTALLDPHGDLVEQVAPLVPRSRTNQVLLFDPSDADWPISFNVFRRGRQRHADPALLSSQLISVFRKNWSAFWGPRLEHVLRNAILAVASDPRATLLFLYRFLTEETLRKSVVEKITDPVVKTFWTREFAGYSGTLKSEATAPVLNKLGAFVSQPLVRSIVAQERSRVDLLEIMKTRGVLLANLATGKIGEDASHLLGGLLLSAIQLASWERPRGGPPFIVYVDEFQHFVNDSLATMLSESRKFGLGLVLAHQYLGQLSDSVKDALLGNVGTMLVFRLGAEDAEMLAPELHPPFTARDLAELPNHQVVVKMLARGRQLAPFSATTLPPSPTEGGTARIAAIREQSRLRHAQPRAEVEHVIAATLDGS